MGAISTSYVDGDFELATESYEGILWWPEHDTTRSDAALTGTNGWARSQQSVVVVLPWV